MHADSFLSMHRKLGNLEAASENTGVFSVLSLCSFHAVVVYLPVKTVSDSCCICPAGRDLRWRRVIAFFGGFVSLLSKFG